MVTREDLHRLVDEIPDCGLEEARRYLGALHEAGGDPVLAQLLLAPEDDEDETPEEAKRIAEAYEDVRARRIFDHDEARRRLLAD
jgi:hypothetical protein